MDNLVIATGVVIGVSLLAVVVKRLIPGSSLPQAPKLLEDPMKKYQVKLVEREEISHDTRRFRFALPQQDMILGLPVGQHLFFSARIDGELVVRAYTPVSSDDDRGFVELVVKVYFKDQHPKFPMGGKMTQYMEAMELGNQIDIRGPNGLLVYEGCGRFAVKPDKKTPPTIRNRRKVGLIAGGSGITPMLQIMRDVLKRADKDNTKLWLVYANQSENDILLRNEIDELQSQHPEQLQVWYTIDRKARDEDWKYDIGFVTSDMLAAHMPPPSDETLILVCGPPPMLKFAVDPALDKLGYSAEMRFAY